MKKKNLPKIGVVFDFRGETRDKKTGEIKPDSEGTVSIRVYEGRKYKVISTGVRVRACEWSDDYYVVRRDDASTLNKRIREQLDKCRNAVAESLYRGNGTPTTAVMKIDEKRDSWLVWIKKQIDINPNIGEKTREHHMTMYKSLLSFYKMRKFSDVKRDVICEWIADVRNRTVKKTINGEVASVKISDSGVHNYWKRLVSYIHIAIEEHLLPADVLKGIKVKKGAAPYRVHLSDEEIERWINTPMPHPYMADARDRFIVQMGTGLAYADLMTKDFTLHERLGEYEVLNGSRVKSKKDYFIVILPEAAKVLERWGWVVPPISSVKYNVYLKDVALRCGIDKHITSHVARHTYACWMLRKGINIRAIMRTLGHKRIATTQIYANMVDEEVLDEFSKLK